jgi:hypothetical protein
MKLTPSKVFREIRDILKFFTPFLVGTALIVLGAMAFVYRGVDFQKDSITLWQGIGTGIITTGFMKMAEIFRLGKPAKKNSMTNLLSRRNRLSKWLIP